LVLIQSNLNEETVHKLSTKPSEETGNKREIHKLRNKLNGSELYQMVNFNNFC